MADIDIDSMVAMIDGQEVELLAHPDGPERPALRIGYQDGSSGPLRFASYAHWREFVQCVDRLVSVYAEQQPAREPPRMPVAERPS